MIKINNCKELNPYDHLNILNHIDNIRITNILRKIENKTSILASSNKEYYIHPCSKENNKIQCSIFYKGEPISDFVRNNYKEILKNLPIINIRIMEVI